MTRKALVAGLLVLAACSSRPSATSTQPGRSDTSGEGAVLGSCVEGYNLQNLAKRSWAFDGTVVSSKKTEAETGTDTVTFHVSRWFKGTSESEVVLETYGLGGITSAGTIAGRPGDRMLVTGEGKTIWTCGFTQPYTAAAAADWQIAFAKG